MSDNFPNISTDGGNMDISVRDPNNSALDMDDSNLPSSGKAKTTTPSDGPAYQGTSGYGFMINGGPTKLEGNAPSGENSSGIPAAQPIAIMTSGDPNSTAVDANDGADDQAVN